MLKKGSKLFSILTSTCPRCHNGRMYHTQNPYLGKILKMNEKCENCGLKFKMEPSFFFGAMYVSYAVGIALGFISFLITYFLFNMGLLASFIILASSQLVFLPLTLRLSRNIWINFFVKYQEHTYQR